MKIGDLVIMPGCEEPDVVGLVLESPRPEKPGRIGVLWSDSHPDEAQGSQYVDYEKIKHLEVVCEGRRSC